MSTVELLFPIESLVSSDTFRVALYLDSGNVFKDMASFEAVNYGSQRVYLQNGFLQLVRLSLAMLFR